MAIICLLWSQTACSLEQVLGLGKEAWLLEILMSKVLRRDRDKSLRKKKGGSKGPDCGDWSHGCEQSPAPAAALGSHTHLLAVQPSAAGLSLTPSPSPPPPPLAGVSPGQAAGEA